MSRDEVFDRIRSALGTGRPNRSRYPANITGNRWPGRAIRADSPRRQPTTGTGDVRRPRIDSGRNFGLIREGETVVVPADLPGSGSEASMSSSTASKGRLR